MVLIRWIRSHISAVRSGVHSVSGCSSTVRAILSTPPVSASTFIAAIRSAERSLSPSAIPVSTSRRSANARRAASLILDGGRPAPGCGPPPAPGSSAPPCFCGTRAEDLTDDFFFLLTGDFFFFLAAGFLFLGLALAIGPLSVNHNFRPGPDTCFLWSKITVLDAPPNDRSFSATTLACQATRLHVSRTSRSHPQNARTIRRYRTLHS